MKRYFPKVIEHVAEQIFGLQEHIFQNMGTCPVSLLGLSIQDSGLKSVTDIVFKGDPRTELAPLLRKAQGVFDAVCVVVEAWSAPDSTYRPSDHPLRKEIVGITIYAQDLVMTMNARIERTPDRLVKDKCHVVSGYEGNLAPDGGRNTTNIRETLATDLAAVLKKQPADWLTVTHRMMDELFALQGARELWGSIIDIGLPQSALDVVHRVFGLHYSCLPPADTHSQYWMLGATLEVDRTERIDFDPYGITAKLGNLYADATTAPEVSWLALEEVPILLFGYLPATGFYNALWEVAAELEGSRHLGSKGLEFLRERTEEQSEQAQKKLVIGTHSFFFTIPLIVKLPLSPKEMDAARATPQSLDYPAALGEVSQALTAQLNALLVEHSNEFAVKVHCVSVEPVNEAINTVEAGLARSYLLDMLGIARRRYPHALRAEITAVHLTEGGSADLIYATLWGEEDDSFALGASVMRMPHLGFPACAEGIAEIFRSEGIATAIYPDVLQVPKKPLDNVAHAAYFPDFRGGWFNPQDLIAPGSRDIVRSLNWMLPRSDMCEDPLIQGLPMPHLLLRLGALEMVQEHYTPLLYKALKEIATDVSLDSDAMWERLGERIPVVKSVDKAAKDTLRPPLVYEYTLRLHWSRSPTFKVRSSLIERLKVTNINLKVPAQLFRAPFKLCFIAFEKPLDYIGWSEEVRDGKNTKAETLGLEGAFVHTTTKGAARVVRLILLGRGVEDFSLTTSHEMWLTIEDETRPLNEYLKRFCEAEQISDEIFDELRPALEEIVKVLVYLALREARTVESKERTEAVKEASGKKLDKQLKVLHRARGLYDHILVGPEMPLELPEAHGFTGRTMPVHVRRGFLNHYWTGKGRTVLRAVFIEEVMVNKHLLKDPNDAPPPKDYRLH
jgi:hypothetical protein